MDEVEFDVTAEGVPPYDDGGTADPQDDSGGIIGYQLNLHYDESKLTMKREAFPSIVLANEGSTLFSVSDALPDEDRNGFWQSSALDIGVSRPEQGAGVLTRLSVGSDNGVVGEHVLYFKLSINAHLDGVGSAYVPDVNGFGAIGLNQSCGNVPTSTPSSTIPRTMISIKQRTLRYPYACMTTTLKRFSMNKWRFKSRRLKLANPSHAGRSRTPFGIE